MIDLVAVAERSARASTSARAQARVQQYFVDSDAGELQAGVRHRAARCQRAGRARTKYVMVPKRKQIREALQRLDLWVDESTALLQAMRMTFANGDTKLMEFEDVVPNAPIDAAVFSVPK